MGTIAKTARVIGPGSAITPTMEPATIKIAAAVASENSIILPGPAVSFIWAPSMAVVSPLGAEASVAE
jgi:hypothetical protein